MFIGTTHIQHIQHTPPSTAKHLPYTHLSYRSYSHDTHSPGVAVFGAFLRSEFSEENLQFYLACEQYKHSSNNFSLQRRARDINNTYIQPGSPREVNLDSKTRDLTIQLLQAPSHTSLNMAQKRIYSLLDLDCYPRFLQSPCTPPFCRTHSDDSPLYTALLQDAQ
ncbi:hypothetical protein WMY93_020475 [Mugilogobius chulae]|uniref:RGS domain-containing protein n=1 Tax=Mugilogobius chulae TaxID=88201 RepID=A0AAW0NS58_9GOBI